MHSAAISVRSAFRPSRMYLKPWPSSPIRFSAGISRLSKNSSLVSWLTMLGIGRTVRPVADRLAQVDDEDRHAFGLLLHLGERRGARQQDHQVRMLDARDPDLLAVDDVAVALLHRRRLDLASCRCRWSARSRPSTAGAARRWRSAAGSCCFCASRAVAQQRAHVVHLAVAGAGVAAAAVDLLHDHRGLGQARGPSRRTPAGSARPASRPWSARRRTASG